MAVSEEDLKQIMDAIAEQSQGVEDLETVSSLSGVNSLPGMKSDKLVSVPIILLQKPATDAAAKAEASAVKADSAAASAEDAKNAANSAASTANESAARANEAASAAEKVSGRYGMALKGATAGFGRFVNDAQITQASYMGNDGTVVFVKSRNLFAYLVGSMTTAVFYNDWNTADMYLDETRSEILKDKIYICEGVTYVWRADDNTLVKSGGGGSGSGFYNITKLHPLGSGYYTKETAVAALADSDIAEEDKPGMIITFEVSAGKWEDYRFEATDTGNWLEPSAWKRFGGGDAIKRIRITKGTASEDLTPNEQGEVSLDIPVLEVDQAVNENSTNPVSGKGVAAELKKFGSTYGTALQLNEIGEGDDKVYSVSLLNEQGDVISTTDQFTGGGGGGSVSAIKVVLTRITPNRTVKKGDKVELVYKYDQIDTTTGESTGNPGRVTVTITQGANTSTLTGNVSAGSTNTVDVTSYMGIGTNTVRVRVEVGEGAEMQVSQITWSINVVQLTLTSSFNIATAINKGQRVTVPYALTGAGNKTLRCYVDGEDTEDRSITTSTANGSFSIDTSGMGHGTHSVQLVVELELADEAVIKSNSIYFGIGIREAGNTSPVFASRFDYADGTVIESGNVPYIQTRQFDNYTLIYTAYNRTEFATVHRKINAVQRVYLRLADAVDFI